MRRVNKLKKWPHIFPTVLTPWISHMNGHVCMDAPLVRISFYMSFKACSCHGLFGTGMWGWLLPVAWDPFLLSLWLGGKAVVCPTANFNSHWNKKGDVVTLGGPEADWRKCLLTKEAHWYTFPFLLFSFGLSPHAYTDVILKPKSLSIFSVPSWNQKDENTHQSEDPP